MNRAPTAGPVAVVAALAIVYVVWGSTYLAIRIALETLPPMLMAASRFLVAGALLTTWALVRRPSATRPTAREWRAAAVVGGLLLLGGNGLVVFAEQHVASGVVALLVASVPLWMALFGRLFFGERLAPAAGIGLAIGFAGVALLVDPGATGRLHPLGTAAALVAAISWGFGSLWSRRAGLPGDALLATGMEMLCGGALLAVVGVAAGELGRLDLAAASGRSLAALAYLTVFGSLVAFTAYAWLLRVVSTSLAATYAYVNPVVALALGWAVLGERITVRMLVAGGVILVAVALIVSRRAPRPSVAGPTAAPAAASTAAPHEVTVT